jgi:hypothetical protein
MARFLTFETTALKLNNSVFPCNSISVSLNANTTPVFDINGNLLYYSPTAPIQGKFSTNFYLTGALPNFLKLENQTEAPVRLSFNQFYIPSAYLTDLSFSVEPFQPISVATSFVFYHGLTVLNTDLNDNHTSFSDSLKTLNGLSSYIVTTDRDTNAENPKDFLITNFDYSFSVERSPVLRIKESIPSRVALKQINAQFGVTANNLDGRLKIQGNNAVFNAILKDNTSLSTSTNFSLTGIIVDQSYSISEGNYGLSNVKMIQNINPKRNIISIPFEIEDYDIEIPESIIDDPNAKPFITDDGKVNNGGVQPPGLAVGNDLAEIAEPQSFYFITDVYIKYYRAFVSEDQESLLNLGSSIEDPTFACEFNNNEFGPIQKSFPSMVYFEPNQDLKKLKLGIITASKKTPPYYYLGKIKIRKQFIKDGGYNNSSYKDFEADYRLFLDATDDTQDLEITKHSALSITIPISWAYNIDADPPVCQKQVGYSFFYWWCCEWSYLKNKIYSTDPTILNSNTDTNLNSIYFEKAGELNK